MAIRRPAILATEPSTEEQIVLPGMTYQPGTTYQQYLDAVEQYPNLRIEYLEGTLVMSPSPVPNHQRVLRELFKALNHFVSAHQLGELLWAPLDVELAPQSRIVEPDLIFIAQDRVAELVGAKQVTGAPDLIVEILSLATARIDRIVKLPLYARSGVAEYWIVDLEEQAVEVYLLDRETYRVAGIFLSGDTITVGCFANARIAVDQIFES